eukprot:4295170-Pyramimonas_sp.AAC.3
MPVRRVSYKPYVCRAYLGQAYTVVYLHGPVDHRVLTHPGRSCSHRHVQVVLVFRQLADVVKQKKAAEGTYWAKAKAKAGVVVSAGGSVLSKAPGVSVFNRSSNRLDPEKEKAKDKEDKVGAS